LMYTNNKMEVAVDKIIRYEHLNEDLISVLNDLGIEQSQIEIPKLKVNARPINYVYQISDDVKALVQEKFHFVFEMMGYPRRI